MSLHHQLLDQAKHLCHKDPRKPQQASLRRAVSASYYALFHFLIDAACREWLGTTNTSEPLRQFLARAFVHAAMKEASRSFQGPGPLPVRVQTAMAGQTVSADLRMVAGTFVKTQELRHQADYDLTRAFVRQDVVIAIQQVEAAMASWKAVGRSSPGRIYLLCLLIWKEVRGGS